MKSFAVFALFCLSLLVNCAGSPNSQPQAQVAPKKEATLAFVEAEYRYLSTDKEPRPIEVRLTLNDEDDGKDAWCVYLNPDDAGSTIEIVEYKGMITRNDINSGKPHCIGRPKTDANSLLVKGSGQLVATVKVGQRTLTAETWILVD